MDILFEAILEGLFYLIVDGGMATGRDKKISRWIRYPVITLVILFLALFLSLFIMAGFMIAKSEVKWLHSYLISVFIVGIVIIVSIKYGIKRIGIKKSKKSDIIKLGDDSNE